MLENLLDNITLRDIVYFTVGATSIISVIVEKSKSIPFHPWSYVFKSVSDYCFKGINNKLDVIEEQQKENNKAINDLENKMDTKFAEKQKDDDEKEAKRLRSNIISFADSCRCGNKHTQSHYENVMRDYDDYMLYCDTHNLPNHYIDNEYDYIKNLYQDRLKKNDFL